MQRKFFIIYIAPIVFLVIAYFFSEKKSDEQVIVPIQYETPSQHEQSIVATNTNHIIIGHSVEGREIHAYTFGTGDQHIIMVGGIHGGYEWNSVVLTEKFKTYFEEHKEIIPEQVTITIIPSLNPDGVFMVTQQEGSINVANIPDYTSDGLGRFNANDVDLNRNFDCKWKPKSTWKGKIVNAGEAPFSEPETRALRDFILAQNPSAIIFFHSKANAVYASECTEGVLPETKELMHTYANASGYPAIETFNAYEVTGDAEGWLASINIPAITVELKTHESIDWEQNLLGVQALLAQYEM